MCPAVTARQRDARPAAGRICSTRECRACRHLQGLPTDRGAGGRAVPARAMRQGNPTLRIRLVRTSRPRAETVVPRLRCRGTTTCKTGAPTCRAVLRARPRALSRPDSRAGARRPKVHQNVLRVGIVPVSKLGRAMSDARRTGRSRHRAETVGAPGRVKGPADQLEAVGAICHCRCQRRRSTPADVSAGRGRSGRICPLAHMPAVTRVTDSEPRYRDNDDATLR